MLRLWSHMKGERVVSSGSKTADPGRQCTLGRLRQPGLHNKTMLRGKEEAREGKVGRKEKEQQ